MKKDIILFGIQGSGKKTQASLLMKKFLNYEYLELGQIFRAITSNVNIISDHIKERMSQWKMLDDSLAIDLFSMYGHLLKKEDCMLIDWFPRSLPQMYYFLSEETKYQRDFIWVHFYISRERTLERLLERSKKEWRKDDNMASILKRLDLFETETLPVIKYFEQMGKLIVVDADNPIDVVYKSFLEQLKKFNCI